jgi:hypothetical protein
LPRLRFAELETGKFDTMKGHTHGNTGMGYSINNFGDIQAMAYALRNSPMNFHELVQEWVRYVEIMNPSANFACLHMSTCIVGNIWKYNHQTLNIEPEHRNIQQSIRLPTLP